MIKSFLIGPLNRNKGSKYIKENRQEIKQIRSQFSYIELHIIEMHIENSINV